SPTRRRRPGRVGFRGSGRFPAFPHRGGGASPARPWWWRRFFTAMGRQPGMSTAPLELVCPAGTPAALRDAVDAGADVVYVGFRDETNARNFPGLNFSRPELRDGIAYAHQRGSEVFVAINTYAAAGSPAAWHSAIDDAAALGADAVIVADIGLLDYAARKHPDLRLHLSVQAAA